LWLKALILVSHSANYHPTISRGFPPAEQTDVVPEQPQALEAVRIDAPAAVAERTDVAPARVEEVACTYYARPAAAEQA